MDPMYYTPSSSLQKRNQPSLTQQDSMNFFMPPANPSLGNSASPAVVDQASAPQQPQYFAPAPAAARPGSMTKTDAQIANEKFAQTTGAYAGAASAGFKNTAVPASTDLASNVASIAGNTLAGAASGAAAGAMLGPQGAVIGGVVGGGIALVTSGLNAWTGNRQARAERDRINSLNADAQKRNAQDRADLERWRTTYRLDSLEAARFERQKYNAESKRQQLSAVQEKLKAILATNTNLKQQWAAMGFN